MNTSYRPYAANQDLLLPPSLQDWLPEDHLAYFISDTVDALNLSAFHDRYLNGGPRNQPFHPAMMVKVLLYGYATGVFSSRKLARKLHEDVAFRLLAANNFPAHRTLSDFRAIHHQALSDLFVQVVKVAGECGLVKLGTVAIDGTKLKANASRHKAMSYGRMLQAEKALKEQIEDLLERAQSADEAEAEEAQLDVPAEIARRELRLASIQAARARLEARQRELDRGKGRSDDDDQQPRYPDGTAKRGPRYKRKFGVPEDKAQENFTDPDSRIMKHSSGAYEQSYNGQTAVDSENRIIIAAELSQNAADSGHLLPMLDAVQANVKGLPEQTLVDAGYRSEAVLEQVEGLSTDVLMAIGREGYDPANFDPQAYPYTAAMSAKMGTDSKRKIYRQRKHIVEPPNGWIKHVLGFRQFSFRGYEKVRSEWKIVCMALNLRRMALL
jgi:transposase